MKRTCTNRRDFLRTSAAAAAGISLPYLIPSRVLGGPDQPGANEKVHVGVIGCGGRSRLIRDAADVPAFQVVAACDCEFRRAEGYVKELSGGAKWGAYADFRKMIEKEKARTPSWSKPPRTPGRGSSSRRCRRARTSISKSRCA